MQYSHFVGKVVSGSSGVVANGLASFGWQHLLTVAPHTLSLLGQIMVIGGERDFSLISTKAPVQYAYIKYPSSFKATLAQLGNEGLLAFQNAEKLMMRMSMALAEIPTKARDAYKILDNPKVPVKVVPLMLKVPMGSMEKLINRCVSAAIEAEDEFNRTQGLLLEIIEVTVMRKGEEEERFEQAKQQLEDQKRKRDEMEKIKAEADEEMKSAEQDMMEAKTEYKKALDAIPTGWELLAQHFVKKLGDAVVNSISLKSNIMNKVNSILPSSDPQQARTVMEQRSQDEGTYELAGKLNEYTSTMQKALDPVNAGENNATAIRIVFNITSHLLASELKRLENVKVVAKASSHLSRARQLVKDGAGKLDLIIKTENDDALLQAVKAEAESFKKWLSEMSNLSLNVTACVPGEQDTSTQTTAAPAQEVTVEERKAALMQKDVERAQLRAKEAKEGFKQARLELDNILSKISELNITKLELEQVIKIAQEALLYLGQLKANWVKLLKFFTILSEITQNVLNTDLDEFKNYISQVENLINTSVVTNQTDPVMDGYKAMILCSEYAILEVSPFLVHIMTFGIQ